MWKPYQDLQWSHRLPDPPIFISTFSKNLSYNVPPFYEFSHHLTSWILTLLTSEKGYDRIHIMAKKAPQMFHSYFQIPDRPDYLMRGAQFRKESPAYNNKAILYLTPLALAVYLKKKDVIRALCAQVDEDNHPLINPQTPSFVQKIYKKNIQWTSNDLCNTTPAILALRRNYNEALILLMNFGVSIQKPFCILYRQLGCETMKYYRDLIDYSIDMQKQRPGFDIASLIRIATTNPSDTQFDIFMFDIVGVPNVNSKERKDFQLFSLFRRLLWQALDVALNSNEVGMTIIAALDELQRLGYFIGNLKQMKDRQMQFGYDINKHQKQQKYSRKVNGDDIIHYCKDSMTLVEQDRAKCIALMYYWFQKLHFQSRFQQLKKLSSLLTRALLDTQVIEIYFEMLFIDIAQVFTDWCDVKETITVETVKIIREHIIFEIENSSQLNQQFCLLYEQSPSVIFKKIALNNRKSKTDSKDNYYDDNVNADNNIHNLPPPLYCSKNNVQSDTDYLKLGIEWRKYEKMELDDITTFETGTILVDGTEENEFIRYGFDNLIENLSKGNFSKFI